VLAYMRRLGWVPTTRPGAQSRRPKRPTPPADKLKLVRRIRAQLISLDRKPDEYADGIARQMFGQQVQFFEWCDHDQLHKITAALGVEQRRKGAPTR
jgi:phage gp16-like protein